MNELGPSRHAWMSPMANDLRALGVAAALHVAAVVTLVAIPAREKPFGLAAAAIPDTEIELAPMAIDDSAPSGGIQEEGRAPHPAIDPKLAMRERSVRGPAAEAEAAAEPEARAPSAAAAEAPPVVSGPADIGLDPTIGGTNPFLARGALPDLPPRPHVPAEKTGTARPPAPTKEEAQQRANAMLREPARRREAELGLGPEGPVLAALSGATHATATPVKGHAVFLAVVDATGIVVKLDVISSDGSPAPWNDAAKKALVALRSAPPLRLPSTAKGAQMTIEVTSDRKLPSGHDPGTRVEVFNIPITEGGGKDSTTMSFFGGSTFELRGDPVDIGAKAQRVVHVKLISSSML